MAVTTSYSVDTTGPRKIMSLAGRGGDGNDATRDLDSVSLANGGFAVSTSAFRHSAVAFFDKSMARTGHALGFSTEVALTRAPGGIAVVSIYDGAIFHTTFDTTGKQLTPLFPPIVPSGYTQFFPDAALQSNGQLAIVASAYHAGTDTRSININVVSIDGTSSGGGALSPNEPNIFGAPSIAVLDGGGYAVAWSRSSGATSAIWQTVYGPSGQALAPSPADSFGSINKEVRAVAMNGGGYGLVYADNGWGHGTTDITLAKFSAQGVFISFENISTGNVNINDASEDSRPEVARLPNGKLVISYTSSKGNGDTIVKLYDPVSDRVFSLANVTAGQAVGDAVRESTITGFGTGQIAVFHSNSTDGRYQGEAFRLVRTSTGDSLNNAITGDSFIDRISGGAGNDLLKGGLGADTLNGGLGIDRLYGGADKDTFVFNVAVLSGHRDVIYDFNRVSDTMQLENAKFIGIGAAGTLRATAFKLATQVKDADDRIIYNKATGALSFDKDGSGAAAPVHFATLANKVAINHFDFVVI